MSEVSTALVAAMRSPVAPPKDGLLYTPAFRLAFPHLDEAWTGQDGKATPAFSCLSVFHEDADLRELLGECNKALVGKFGKDALEQVRYGTYRYPVRPKAAMTRFAGFEGPGYFASLRAQDNARPQCIAYLDGQATPLQPGAIERHLYAGAYAYAVVSVYAYDNVGKGVGLGLRTLVKIADGERFGGPKAATAEEALEAVRHVSLPPGLLQLSQTAPEIEGKAEAAGKPVPPGQDLLASILGE